MRAVRGPVACADARLRDVVAAPGKLRVLRPSLPTAGRHPPVDPRPDGTHLACPGRRQRAADRPATSRSTTASRSSWSTSRPEQAGAHAGGHQRDVRRQGRQAQRRDRRRPSCGADYIMWVDSDDFVSNRLTEFVHTHHGDDGWYSDAGYFHVAGSRTVRPLEHEFHQRNGSTHILRADITGVPPTVEPSMTRTAVIDAVGQRRRPLDHGRPQVDRRLLRRARHPARTAALPVGGLGDRYRRELLPGATASGPPAAGRRADLGGVRVPVPEPDQAVRTSVLALGHVSPGARQPAGVDRGAPRPHREPRGRGGPGRREADCVAGQRSATSRNP